MAKHKCVHNCSAMTSAAVVLLFNDCQDEDVHGQIASANIPMTYIAHILSLHGLVCCVDKLELT